MINQKSAPHLQTSPYRSHQATLNLGHIRKPLPNVLLSCTRTCSGRPCLLKAMMSSTSSTASGSQASIGILGMMLSSKRLQNIFYRLKAYKFPRDGNGSSQVTCGNLRFHISPTFNLDRCVNYIHRRGLVFKSVYPLSKELVLLKLQTAIESTCFDQLVT